MIRLATMRRLAAGTVLATTATFLTPPALLYGQDGPRNGGKKPAVVQKTGRVPDALVGSWTWGAMNPGRYVDKRTGEYVGHAGGGSISYTFNKDGSHKRYVLIHLRGLWEREHLFGDGGHG